MHFSHLFNIFKLFKIIFLNFSFRREAGVVEEQPVRKHILERAGSSGSDKMWDLTAMLKLEPTTFADGWDISKTWTEQLGK